MNYAACLEYLDSLGKFGIHLGMERIQAVLKELKNPETRVKMVHVTGTNGKGSVATMVEHILLAAGLRVGKFTSPHLVQYNERIAVDGRDIGDDDFARAVTAARTAADKVVAKGVCEQPTQFEILTAAAFWYFADLHLDYAVIEVGLGGLWDSTNVITPLVSVITNVELEHTDRLGDTIEKIAMQKAGIIKEKVPVVTAASDEALGPIKAFSLFRQAPIYVYGRAFRASGLMSSLDGQTFNLQAGDNYQSAYHIQLPGDHQLVNASLAIVAAKLVSKQDPRITEEHLHAGVAAARWPGRLERIGTSPTVLLDGAHNPNGASVLRAALDKFLPGQPVHFVFGMMADKDMTQVMQLLFHDGDTVYAVTADDSPRAAQAEDVAQLVRSVTPRVRVLSCPDVLQAYHAACAEAGTDGVVVVCGSLYLVGNFKRQLAMN